MKRRTWSYIEQQKVKEKAIVNGLKNEIHFLGNVNDVEVQLWKSHLYIHSAYYEPFGLALLEAMNFPFSKSKKIKGLN